MAHIRYLLPVMVLSVIIAGCGTQSSSSQAMSSSSPMTSSSSAAKSGQVVLSNGHFHPAHIQIAKGQTLTFVFDGMGQDHLDLLNQGHLVARSPDLNQGGKWQYTFKTSGTYTIEPETMTYIHGTISVHS
ncbi:cupredoxin domain-containing protein [Sulfobacillus thermosulfidooxidans]|uniref:cupredoxin domain-containing protein n=1 Tax=Sulfobacillus thermosulfidooxidans TaxID=28034 RepID=UPI0006B4C610|nr:cupredoxin domain-containing protein [Sulfobacillus thermosulfidooxidans]